MDNMLGYELSDEGSIPSLPTHFLTLFLDSLHVIIIYILEESWTIN